MDALQRFMAYAADFEKTFDDDDWSRLEPYFAEDAVYVVEGIPQACRLEGRDAILRGIRKSLDGFDRRFDGRVIEPDGPPEVEGRRVVLRGAVHYDTPGLPRLSLRMQESAELDDAGRIVELRDTYPEGQDEALAWLAEHGAGLDPSYR